MAQIPGFEYDIFISYTHRDNHSSTDDPGWVDRFHAELESWLKFRRGFSDLVIWRDKQLDGNSVFNASIEDKIKKSALFFVLNSRNYPNSDYCRKELKWFHQYHGERPGGLIVGEHHRVFNILLCNIPFEDWPEELSETGGFAMHDAQSEAELGDFTSPNDDQFQKQLRAVVDAVEATLVEFSKLRTPPGVREERHHDVKIFVADVDESLADFKQRIIAETAGTKVQVITDIPPPEDSAQHSASVEQALAQADLSIHLFSGMPGRNIPDHPGCTYSRMQWEIALNSTAYKLVWIPADLRITEEDDAHQKFLNNLANNDRVEGQYEFVRTGQTDFINVIQDKIAQLQLPTGNGSPRRTFLVDTHQKDQLSAFKLAEFLLENDVDVDFNHESHDPILSLTKFEQSVRQVQNLILLAGKVEESWLKGRIIKAFKIASEQFEAEESSALENIWVFLAPASEGRVKLPNLPPLLNINVLDNSHEVSIDPRVVSPLLQQASAGGSA